MVTVLFGVIIVVAVVVGVAAAIVFRRRARDDVHSVEHYHRRLHTLEEIRTHEAAAGEGTQAAPGEGNEHFPVSAVRVAGTPSVHVTGPEPPPVPASLPPHVDHPSEPITFDDMGSKPEPMPRTFMTGAEDRAMHSINQRPRRLAGPLTAVAAVLVLVVVLIVTGLHTNTTPHATGRGVPATTAPPARGAAPRTSTTLPPHARSHHPGATKARPATTTTVPPVVSAPGNVSAHAATYQLAASTYTLAVAATSGPCWVQITDTATGAVLFSQTLQAGQRTSLSATGPAAVEAGAPSVFVVAIDGRLVPLPAGSLAPFTLTFQPAAAG